MKFKSLPERCWCMLHDGTSMPPRDEHHDRQNRQIPQQIQTGMLPDLISEIHCVTGSRALGSLQTAHRGGSCRFHLQVSKVPQQQAPAGHDMGQHAEE